MLYHNAKIPFLRVCLVSYSECNVNASSNSGDHLGKMIAAEPDRLVKAILVFGIDIQLDNNPCVWWKSQASDSIRTFLTKPRRKAPG